MAYCTKRSKPKIMKSQHVRTICYVLVHRKLKRYAEYGIHKLSATTSLYHTYPNSYSYKYTRHAIVKCVLTCTQMCKLQLARIYSNILFFESQNLLSVDFFLSLLSSFFILDFALALCHVVTRASIFYLHSHDNSVKN